MTVNEKALQQLNQEIIKCKKCPRLVAWREKIAKEKVRRFAHETYWGKPIPGFGDVEARLLLVGLAPAAHGGNRTGRMFTGDRSGDWLYSTLYRFGFANQPESLHKDDGLKLKNCYITASMRCAPPKNKPTSEELKNCFPYLVREMELLPNVRVIVPLGKIAFDAVTKALKERNILSNPLKAKFGHGVEIQVLANLWILCSYHPSQQNTFTGRLTQEMFDAVFQRAKELIGR